MDTATLKQIFIKELDGYTGASLNDVAYLTANEAKGIYTIVDFTTARVKRLCSTVLVARLAGDRVVIELDRHDKLLADAQNIAIISACHCLRIAHLRVNFAKIVL